MASDPTREMVEEEIRKAVEILKSDGMHVARALGTRLDKMDEYFAPKEPAEPPGEEPGEGDPPPKKEKPEGDGGEPAEKPGKHPWWG